MIDYKKVEISIRDFHFSVLAIEQLNEKLDQVFNFSPESEYYSVIHELIGGYIKALDAAYNIGGWLEWWIMECNLGKNVKNAGLPGEKLRSIKYIDDFVKIVIDDIKLSDKK